MMPSIGQPSTSRRNKFAQCDVTGNVRNSVSPTSMKILDMNHYSIILTNLH